MRKLRFITVLAGLVLAACGSADEKREGSASSTGANPTATEAESQTGAGPVIDDAFPVSTGGRELAIRCWGEGSPAIVIETGHPGAGIADFGTPTLVDPLAEQTMVCAYDRLGQGLSDAAPQRPRDVDDLVEDLYALLAAAEVPAPHLLVGQSFGGLPAVHYAGRYPDEVAGLVLLDVPPPDPNLTAEIAPEAAWDHPANLERVDALDTERRLAEDRLPISPIPVTIVSATDGAGGPEQQEYWLKLSTEAEQVVLEGGHDLHLEDPEGVLEQILNTLRRPESS